MVAKEYYIRNGVVYDKQGNIVDKSYFEVCKINKPMEMSKRYCYGNPQ